MTINNEYRTMKWNQEIGGAPVPRSEYRNPPVHEVIISIQFRQTADSSLIDDIASPLRDRFPVSARANRIETVFSLGPEGKQAISTESVGDGWIFRDEGNSRVLQARSSSASLHFVRPGKWPAGPYLGWDTIYSAAVDVVELLRGTYGDLGVKRAGVRYLNRIAVPRGTDIGRWLSLVVSAPSSAQGLFSFEYRHTWERLSDFENLSATIGVQKIAVEEESLAKECEGVLLDIEVFNLRVANAPLFDDLAAWLSVAHERENLLFHECTTEALRERFGRIDARRA